MIAIPFDFNPVDNIENSATYTVGSGDGDFAIISVTLSAEARGTNSGGSSTQTLHQATAGANATTIPLHLKEGSVLTKLETAASATTGAVASGSVSDTSIASILVDGVVVGTVKASASASHVTDTTATSTVAGSANVEWHIAEYNQTTAP